MVNEAVFILELKRTALSTRAELYIVGEICDVLGLVEGIQLHEMRHMHTDAHAESFWWRELASNCVAAAEIWLRLRTGQEFVRQVGPAGQHSIRPTGVQNRLLSFMAKRHRFIR